MVALGAATGIDEVALAGLGVAAGAAAAVTVGAYLAACIACVVSVAGSAVWDEITAPINVQDLWLRSQLTAQAEAQNIPNPADAQDNPDPTFNA